MSKGAIQPLCELLTVSDPRIVLVAMEGLENILRVGDQDAKHVGFNQFATLVDEFGGVDNMFQLQNHRNHEIYKKGKGKSCGASDTMRVLICACGDVLQRCRF